MSKWKEIELEDGEYRLVKDNKRIKLERLYAKDLDVTSQCEVVLRKSSNCSGYYIAIEHDGRVIAVVEPDKGILVSNPLVNSSKEYRLLMDSNAKCAFHIIETKEV